MFELGSNYSNHKGFFIKIMGEVVFKFQYLI